MPKYKVGDVLKSRQFKDVKVLAILDDLIAYRADNGTIMWLNEELRNQYGYTLAQPARWVPGVEGYFYIRDDGHYGHTLDLAGSEYEFRLSSGNCFESIAEAEAYKRRWQEWGGRV
jgi:hypothetical protein